MLEPRSRAVFVDSHLNFVGTTRFQRKTVGSEGEGEEKIVFAIWCQPSGKKKPQLLAFGVYIPSDVHLIISSHHSDIVARFITLESPHNAAPFGAVLVASESDMNFLHKLQTHLSDANNYDAEWSGGQRGE